MNRITKIEELKPGDRLSEIQFYEVVSTTSKNVEVRNERGLEFSIGSKIVEEGLYTATQYNEEIKMTRTELCEVFSTAFNAIFSVTFNKQVKAKDVNDAVATLNKGGIKPTKEMQKIVKDVFKGVERTVVGYLVKRETGLGRSVCIDLLKDKGDNPKWDGRIVQVDHRTIKSLIYKNIKYTVK